MFPFFSRHQEPYAQSASEDWRNQWRSIVPPECRNVPVTEDGKSVVAYILINHFAVMLQDGLLMEASFFDVCEHFQKAGYHVIWVMRCTQDIHNGYLRLKRTYSSDLYGKDSCHLWRWKKPTTNFDHWISDNRDATILIQHQEIPDGPLDKCEAHILSRVTWALSNDPTKLVPGKTDFQTVDLPASPAQLKRWLEGASLSSLEG